MNLFNGQRDKNETCGCFPFADGHHQSSASFDIPKSAQLLFGIPKSAQAAYVSKFQSPGQG